MTSVTSDVPAPSDAPGENRAENRPVRFDELLDRLVYSGLSPQEQGRRFERLAKRFLQVEPKYAELFSDVWLRSEWPGRAVKSDVGADLIARNRETGELTAIQAKFYAPEHKLAKSDIDSFFTELGKTDFAYGMVINTSLEWTNHAREALDDQSKQVTTLGIDELTDSTVDWSQFSFENPEHLVLSPQKQPRHYQQRAIQDVLTGFEQHDRGRLIMACGTGKTFTSLKLVEQQVPVGGSVLFLVPSIALLQQTLNEWTAQAATRIRAFAVCSDTTVGSNTLEDISAVEIGFPATTDPVRLANRSKISTGQDAITVVFSTYQSIEVVAQAQYMGLPAFDLIVCDEAHRTTGISQPGADESAFVRVHDQHYLKAAKRLYMTATPRIYVEESKSKANDDGVGVFSMDDESVYGPEFHHLGFGQAVEMGALADYKVLVLAVDEASVSRSFQSFLAEDGSDIPLPDVARVVGIWNGLSKRGADGQRLAINDTSPMQRAVAFASTIADSKQITDRVERVGRELLAQRSEDQPELTMQARHVDGTFSALDRSAQLEWLQADAGPRTCRILSNARCLTEGVDVPSLDSVIFLNPRNSQVDVVQAVGRVMRRAAGKEYGYIILPIAVNADADPETALNDNKKYKVVWDVLQALRAHDDRFEALVNKVDLAPEANDRLDVIAVGDPAGVGNEDGTGTETASHHGATEALFSWATAAEWKNAIYARMVKKVGDRRYWEDWAADVKDMADRQRTRIQSILDSDPRPREEFEVFLQGLRGNLNDGITEANAVDMLVQHLITTPVFNALFEDYDFAGHNAVSQVMDSMLAVLDAYHLESETDALADFYRSVRIRAEGITNAEGKQRIITELYERFFKLAFPHVAESLGIVYTPVEVVDFIIRAVDDVLAEQFGTSLSGQGVHVLDPFTGTGTLLVRLLQSGRIRPEDLLRKYTQELHANEILLMPYYIAAINIEATFHALQLEARAQESLPDDGAAGSVGRPASQRASRPEGTADSGAAAAEGGYVPFEGIVLTDTFQMTEDGDTLDQHVFTSNNDRAQAQNALDIRVIVGNPPYSAGQTSANDNNANQSYLTLDESIRSTYAARSTATNKNSLYDSYIRAIRWASNRVLGSEQGGVVCYVTNGGYIDGNTADGLRLTLAEEFHDIYVYNLRGNQRTVGEQSRREGGKIFDSGSRNTVAVLLLVKRPGPVDRATLHYQDIGDYLDRAQKLALVDEATLESLDWTHLEPNEHGDWINQRDEDYASYPPIGDKKDRSGHVIFGTFGAGLQTKRDAWVYNSSQHTVASNVARMIENYNAEVERWVQSGSPRPAKSFVTSDPRDISWSSSLLSRFEKQQRIEGGAPTTTSIYRPFNRQILSRQRELLHRPAVLDRYFPTAELPNVGFYNVGNGSAVPFSVLALDALPDLHVTGAGSGGQFFARYSYEPVGSMDTTSADPADAQGDLFAQEAAPSSSGPVVDGYRRVDNITDWALQRYRAAYGERVSKDDVFHYVYGLLHSPEYRQRYAADLKKQLPRIPEVPGRDRFEAFVAAGRELAELHVGYEDVEPYPLTETVRAGAPEDAYERFAVRKLKYGGKAGQWDKTRIVYNAFITVGGIPEQAQRYLLGSRSGLDWILERYQVKTDKASGIVNDPNDWSREHGQPRYIIDLIGKVTRVSVETMRIVDGLPGLGLED